jgi:hypothetical protein
MSQFDLLTDRLQLALSELAESYGRLADSMEPALEIAEIWISRLDTILVTHSIDRPVASRPGVRTRSMPRAFPPMNVELSTFSTSSVMGTNSWSRNTSRQGQPPETSVDACIVNQTPLPQVASCDKVISTVSVVGPEPIYLFFRQRSILLNKENPVN